MTDWIIYENLETITGIFLIILFISFIFNIALLLAINSIQKDVRTMLKMQSYDFQKDHPEKALKELIKDRYAYYKVRF